MIFNHRKNLPTQLAFYVVMVILIFPALAGKT